MKRKKILSIICGAAAAAAILALSAVSIVLNVKLRESEKLCGEWEQENMRLAAMIDSGMKAEEDIGAERGAESGIPDEIYDKIFGTTLFDDSPVKRENLVYLTIPYYNFDGETELGHMIVNKKVADDVLSIFAELYSVKYPIEKMDIAEAFDSSQSALLNSTELASKGSNNTCALYYSVENGEFLPHAFGTAIDVNPKINPSRDIYGAPVPKNAGKYANGDDLTEVEQSAKITEESEIYRIFTEHGWTWDSSDPCCFIA